MENNNTNFNNPTPQFVNPQFNQQGGQMPLPNSTAVLVLGILSIVTCFCYGIIGIILGIIALILASKATTLYKENPNAYLLASYNNMKGGKICAIIGLCLSGLYIIFIIAYILIIGAALTAMPWDMMKH
ncbi:MAG: CCC motif membrane protein [Bacteroidota bacterium]|jgi:hypothetical protein